jgi:hypothetical protein
MPADQEGDANSIIVARELRHTASWREPGIAALAASLCPFWDSGFSQRG